MLEIQRFGPKAIALALSTAYYRMQESLRPERWKGPLVQGLMLRMSVAAAIKTGARRVV